MKTLPVLFLGLALIVSSSAHAGKDDAKSLIVGQWEVLKSDEAPAGSLVRFSKDGKLKMIPKGTDKKVIEASYSIDGKKLTTTRVEDGKKEVNVLTIETLNETTLITVNEKGKRDELKRSGKPK